MLFLVLIPLVVVAMFGIGYRKVAIGSSPQTANGVLVLVLAVGATVWVLDNLTL